MHYLNTFVLPQEKFSYEDPATRQLSVSHAGAWLEHRPAMINMRQQRFRLPSGSVKLHIGTPIAEPEGQIVKASQSETVSDSFGPLPQAPKALQQSSPPSSVAASLGLGVTCSAPEWSNL